MDSRSMIRPGTRSIRDDNRERPPLSDRLKHLIRTVDMHTNITHFLDDFFANPHRPRIDE